MKYTCINIQGNLVSEDILQKIEDGITLGQQPRDFGLESAGELRSEIEYAWSRVKLDWQYFRERRDKLPANDPYGTSLAKRWVSNFLSALHFDLSPQRKSLDGGNGHAYAISHVAENLNNMPVQIVGFEHEGENSKNTLDIKSGGGTSRLSPHGAVQEYLNATEHLYGIASNGLTLRLIRDSGRLVKLTYLEVDLLSMMEEDQYSEFTLVYRLLHGSRFPRNKQEADECFLEKYYQESIESGHRIRDGLSFAVKESLLALGNGLLTHESNELLRTKLRQGDLKPEEFFTQLLRIIYRLLFVMVTEERDLMYDPNEKDIALLRKKDIYWTYYSLSRLRRLSRNRYMFEKQFTDLWQGLMQTFRLFEADGKGTRLGIQPLGGDLFSDDGIKDLKDCLISNGLILECIRNLNEFEDVEGNLVNINYRALDVEELGSVYEGLLELHPVIVNTDEKNPSLWNFTFHEGTERKTTGSYYTSPDLVNELIKSALIPVIEEKLVEAEKAFSKAGKEAVRNARAKVLLSLKVCDPAAGSGHMILAAARTIAWYHAREVSGEDNPAPSVFRYSMREVIQHCIYAVDYNPAAVELCKLALWLESHSSGKPISFLDHKIRNGNSLVGVTDLSVIKNGIPDDAFKPVTGDDKAICRELKNENSRFHRTKQASLDFDQLRADEMEVISHAYHDLESIRQDSISAVQEARELYAKIRDDKDWYTEWTACNLWTSAFFYNYTEENQKAAITTEKLNKFLQHPAAAYGPMVGKANGMAVNYRFFHWPLEFPDVFEQGGFDVMLGNPPWERIKLQQQEFFSTRDSKIANAANAAERNRLIAQLPKKNPELYNEYEQALHVADCTAKFLREGGRYKLTAVGDINTYSVFSEVFSSLISNKGRAGFIVPTGIATDDSNKVFFGKMVEKNKLVSLFDFENREAIFPGVHRSYKFCLLTLSGSDIGSQKARFGFFLTRVEHLEDKLRVFSLSKEDFLRLNPNTKTCPVFRTSVDAELTTKIYKRVPILINEQTGENPWGVKFATMFHMSNDSHLFRTREQLEGEGFHLWGNKMKKGEEIWLPLYEAKMIWHYDHRFGTYEGLDGRTSTITPTLTHYENPCFQILPWYWVSEESVIYRTNGRKFLFGWRDITNSTNERTMVNSVCPLSGSGDTLLLMLTDKKHQILLLSNLSAIVFDYFVRQKIGGVHLKYHYTKQLPILDIANYHADIAEMIIPRALELIYTSWDIKAFADHLWEESNSSIRRRIEFQWEDNKTDTNNSILDPPSWIEFDPEETPVRPFKWDVTRRLKLTAELDAMYAKLYGLTTEELMYILDPTDVYGIDFPGETFRVLKNKEIRQFGEFRTKRMIMEAWEALSNGILK